MKQFTRVSTLFICSVSYLKCIPVESHSVYRYCTIAKKNTPEKNVVFIVFFFFFQESTVAHRRHETFFLFAVIAQ